MITRKCSPSRAAIAVAVTAFATLALLGGGCKSSDEAANTTPEAASGAAATAAAPAAPAVSPQVQAQIDAFRQADAQQRATHMPGQAAAPNLPGH